MIGKMVTLGWQWTCEKANDGCNDDDAAYEDCWQNPEKGTDVLNAAKAHANRTGHVAWVERHQRMQITPRRKGVR